MSKKKEDKQRYLDKLEEHQVILRENLNYSWNRFEILTVTLSGGGLALSLTLLENTISNAAVYNLSLIKASWILFSFAIIANFISQFSSYKISKLDLVINKNKIRQERDKPLKIDLKSKNKQCKNWNIFNGLLNWVSGLTLISGILTLICFAVRINN